MLARSHGTKSEGQAQFAGRYQPFHVVGEGYHPGGNLQIEVGQGAIGARRACCDGIEEEGGVFGDEGGAEPAVAYVSILPSLDLLAFYHANAILNE